MPGGTLVRHLDLFSGIGGFAYAADQVWEDVEHIFCDIDPFCRAVLHKHWPESPIFSDIKELTGLQIFETMGVYEKLRRSSCDVPKGNVDSRGSEFLQNNPTSYVDSTQTPGDEIQAETTLQRRESLLPGDESKWEGSRHRRESGREGNTNPPRTVREVPGKRELSWDTGTPPRLQQTTRSHVVMSTMPPRLAQEEQTDTLVSG